MSKLVEALYPVPDFRRSPLSLLHWWESRRLTYNKVVGATGLVSAGITELFLSLPPHHTPVPLLPALGVMAAVAVLGNLCYTFGWIAEVVARRVWGRKAPYMGPLLFRQGLIFSVGVVFVPAGLASLQWLARCVAFLFGL